MISVRADVSALEEQVLRLLYEGSASARECAAGLAPYARLSVGRVTEIEGVLLELAFRSYVVAVVSSGATRYSLTSAGSLRLADLAE